MTYRITASNAGPATATNVVVTDPVPANSTYVSAVPTQGTCALVATTVTCTLGSLTSGASATVDIVFRATAVGSISNTAAIQADQADPAPGNNSATAPAITVVDPASIPSLSMYALMALAAALAMAAMQKMAS